MHCEICFDSDQPPVYLTVFDIHHLVKGSKLGRLNLPFNVETRSAHPGVVYIAHFAFNSK